MQNIIVVMSLLLAGAAVLAALALNRKLSKGSSDEAIGDLRAELKELFLRVR